MNVFEVFWVVCRFYYLGHRDDSVGIPKWEIRDALKTNYGRKLGYEIITNELCLTTKHKFVLKYLDALDTGKLKITGSQKDNWDCTKHRHINERRRNTLIAKYCAAGMCAHVTCCIFM